MVTGELLSSIDTAWASVHEELFEAKTHDAIRLRMHRAFSWIRKANSFDGIEDVDAKLVFSWIALNTLYAKWDSKLSEREKEFVVRESFLRHMVKQDKHGRIQQLLLARRKYCDRILSEEHLINSYWGDPSMEEARKVRGKPRKIGKHYHDSEEVIKVLIPLIKCVSMLRSQLVHGMSTYSSSANREVVESGSIVIFDLVVTMLQIITLDGLWQNDEEWEPVPYPPMVSHLRRDAL